MDEMISNMEELVYELIDWHLEQCVRNDSEQAFVILLDRKLEIAEAEY